MENTFGSRIRKLRKDADKTQEDVAKFLGVKSKSVSRWELNLMNPSYGKLLGLSEYFNVPVVYLTGDSGKYKASKVEQIIKELIKEKIIVDADNLDQTTISIIINAVRIDVAMQLREKD
jgi:transcriptional regulator with XRE-family HTH domain